MELAQIRYFIAAAQFQNLSKAARVLNITQPALSKSISKLEDELGVALFERSGKSVALNDSGERFLEYAINSVKELDDAVDSVKNRVCSPTIYVGLLVHSDRFMKCLGDFSMSNPGIGFEVEHLEVAPYSFDTNEFDMLLYPQDQLFHKYKGNVIYSDPYVMAVHKSNPLARKETVRINDATAQKMVFLRHSNKLLDLPYHLCVSLDIHLSDSIFTNSCEIQRWLVSNNFCVSFVPQGGSGVYAVDPDIKLLPVDDDGLRQNIMVGFKREKHLSEVGKKFAQFVCGYFGIK